MKKRFIFFIIIFFIICFIGIYIFLNNMKNRKENEIENIPQFLIQKVHCYSSASAISNTTNYQNPEWNLKVYQYTDIAIYLDRIANPDDKNYIDSIFINNIKFEDQKNGQVSIYYLNPLDFGDGILKDEDAIDNQLVFSVINSKNKENELNYKFPIFFEDCSNPITLRYVNYVSNEYKVDNSKTLTYNGGLLRDIGIGMDSLRNAFDLDINIVTKNEEMHKQTLSIEIPLEKSDFDIYDKGIEYINNMDIEF